MDNLPRESGFTKLYNDQITGLCYWFLALMRDLPPFHVTEAEMRMGTDCLEGDWERMVEEAFDFFLKEMHYELSYNQMNIAFWWSARKLGKVS